MELESELAWDRLFILSGSTWAATSKSLYTSATWSSTIWVCVEVWRESTSNITVVAANTLCWVQNGFIHTPAINHCHTIVYHLSLAYITQIYCMTLYICLHSNSWDLKVSQACLYSNSGYSDNVMATVLLHAFLTHLRLTTCMEWCRLFSEVMTGHQKVMSKQHTFCAQPISHFIVLLLNTKPHIHVTLGWYGLRGYCHWRQGCH